MGNPERKQVPVDPRGRLVIPSNIRRAMGIRPGESLVALVKDGQVVLKKADYVMARLKTTFDNVPRDDSLAD